MAREFFTDIDLNQNEMQFLVMHPLASAPSSGSEVEGQMYYDTVAQQPFFWNGAAWTSMSSGAASSVPFSGITGGTNISATMLVGTGASLSFVGLGTIDANLLDGRLVDAPAAQDGEFLIFTGGSVNAWQARKIIASDFPELELDDLSNVDVASANDGDILVFSGGSITSWENRSFASLNVSVYGHTHDGSDIVSGTIIDDRLSTNVGLLNRGAQWTSGQQFDNFSITGSGGRSNISSSATVARILTLADSDGELPIVSDVSPAEGEVLVRNSSDTYDSRFLEFNDLSDVDYSGNGPSDGDLLVYLGGSVGAWVHRSPEFILTDLPYLGGGGAVNQVAYWESGDSLIGESEFTYNGTDLTLSATGSSLHLTSSTSGMTIGSSSVVHASDEAILIITESGSDDITFRNTNTSNDAGSAVEFQRSRGTIDSPSAVNNNDIHGEVRWFGHNGSTYIETATIVAQSTEAASVSGAGTRLVFSTLNNATPGSPSTKLILDNDGVKSQDNFFIITANSEVTTQTLFRNSGTGEITIGDYSFENLSDINYSNGGPSDGDLLVYIAGSIDGWVHQSSESVLSEYVHINPSTSTRNDISAQGSIVVPLRIVGASGQTANLFEIEDNSNTDLFIVDSSGNVNIAGDLTISGTTTTVDTTNLIVEDNFIVVNSAGVVQDAGIEVERGGAGSGDNAFLRFNESNNEWYVDNGTVSHLMARKYVEEITGDDSTTTFNILHDMGSLYILIQVFDSNTGKQVEIDVDIFSSDRVDLNFKSAPAGGQSYRVIVVG